jgi:spore coat protein I
MKEKENNKETISTKDLTNLAKKILAEYDLIIQDISIIQSGGIKTVWKIKTSDKTMCLKRLRQTYDKVLFSVNAQIHINNQGGNVPGVVINKKGEPIVLSDNEIFVLYEWLDGVNLSFNKSNELEAAIKALATFHKASKGYNYPEGSRESSKFGHWPDLYTSMKTRFEKWKSQESTSSFSSSHGTYLNYVDSMIENANSTLEYLDKSQYKNLVSQCSDLKVLCHQDFGVGNVISTSKGVIVLDLDSVTFDFSVRDLRKIIGKLSQKSNKFDIRVMNTIISWYSAINPINAQEKNLLYIDLLFPHWFHGVVKNQYLKNQSISSSEIKGIAEFEKNKFPAVKQFLN